MCFNQCDKNNVLPMYHLQRFRCTLGNDKYIYGVYKYNLTSKISIFLVLYVVMLCLTDIPYGEVCSRCYACPRPIFVLFFEFF